MLKVRAIPGEPTCFFCESNELICDNPQCSKLYRRLPASYVQFSSRQKDFLRALGLWNKVERHLKQLEQSFALKHREGDACAKCGQGKLRLREHKVDISEYGFSGWCSCEYFEFTCAPELAKLSRSQQGAGTHRCQHVWAARDFALDLSIMAHERDQ